MKFLILLTLYVLSVIWVNKALLSKDEGSGVDEVVKVSGYIFFALMQVVISVYSLRGNYQNPGNQVGYSLLLGISYGILGAFFLKMDNVLMCKRSDARGKFYSTDDGLNLIGVSSLFLFVGIMVFIATTWETNGCTFGATFLGMIMLVLGHTMSHLLYDRILGRFPYGLTDSKKYHDSILECYNNSVKLVIGVPLSITVFFIVVYTVVRVVF